MDDILNTVSMQIIDYSQTYPLSRVTVREDSDGTVIVTFLLKELSDYGRLQQDPQGKDKLIGLWFGTLTSSGFAYPEFPRFSFRFTVDL